MECITKEIDFVLHFPTMKEERSILKEEAGGGQCDEMHYLI